MCERSQRESAGFSLWRPFTRGVGLIDTHTHLDSFARSGVLPAILQRARDADLDAMIAIGTDTDDWPVYRELAREHPGLIHFTVGLHPCNVREDWEPRVAQLARYWEELNLLPVALGEIGLDRFHLSKDPAEEDRIFGWQQAACSEQLRLAKQLDCRVVIHSRGAFAESLQLIDASGVDWRKVVFHCFVESAAEMAQLNERGGVGSFTGVITYKNAATVREAALAQGLDRLMIETDAPYLTPMPHRGKPNEPAYLRHTAEACAQLFGMGSEELAAVTSTNARRFFGIS